MIPDRVEFWLASSASRLPVEPTASTGPLNHQPLVQVSNISNRYEDDYQETNPAHRRGDTAWKRYCSYVESMTTRGQKINQRLALEAMFRGNNLVYQVQPNLQTQDCGAL